MNTRILTAAALLFPAFLAAQSDFDIALIGDMPYGTASIPKFERVIADINKANVDFTIHIGDTKSGSTRCDDSHYTQVRDWFNSFDKPLLYSIGDNEWTDCMRANNGGYDPLTRLDLVRKTLFATPMSLGAHPIVLQRQSSDPQYKPYVENVMLVRQPVVFVTIHMPGSNNNLEYKTVQGAANPFYDNDKEYAARNAANIAWLHQAFTTARNTGALRVMIASQANVFESFMDTGTGSTHSGFADFISALREETNKFAGEVVMVSGDSHYMRVDKPLTDKYPACTSPTGNCTAFDAALDARGTTVLNFTRAEVPGSANVHWMVAHIRPKARNLFSFEFQILPEIGSGPAGPTISITASGTSTGANAWETNSSQFDLNASKSVTTNGGPLQYSWTPAPGYPAPSIARGDTASPTLQFPGKGTYQLTLTVTDRTGATATATVTIRYV